MRDVSRFRQGNIMDTCAVWNVLSSPLLLRAALRCHCDFAMTGVVLYECLVKPRSRQRDSDDLLRARLEQERAAGRFQAHQLSLEDLQAVARLRQRRQLGHGELASIAFVKRTATAFCSDDLKAQKLAQHFLDDDCVQTTPHLLGWLVFTGALSAGDIEPILNEHEKLDRPLRPHLKAMYEEGQRCRLLGRPRK
jgi:hypothetical protein